MALVIVAVDGKDAQMIVNTAHIVSAKVIAPPVTKIKLSNGKTFRLLISLPDLMAADRA